MREIVRAALDFIELFNQGTVFPECDLEVYRPVIKIDFPRDEEGDICAVIHPERQDKDWFTLEPGDPLFLTGLGQTIPYSSQHSVCPVFLNEAAYYEKGTALCGTEQTKIRVPAIRREGEGQ
uniref:aspartoacylase-like n=1 Tax=Pristiophorus japonicus TaxID=55135 RepID=UPI00398F8693